MNRPIIDTAELRNLLSTTPADQEFGLAPDVCHELLSEIDRLRAALLDVLRSTAVMARPCKRCGKQLYFVRGGYALIAFTVDGRNHFNHCPHLKKNAATQEALFDAAPIPD